MEIMDEKMRLQLNNMIKCNNVSDQTNLIRNLKHSQLLRENINKVELLKKNGLTIDELNLEALQECSFLLNYYPDLYIKIRNNEIDLTILNQFLNVLKKIEDGDIDQHEGSFEIGTLLKRIYIDSALKKANKLNDLNQTEEETVIIEKEDITWKQYKIMNKIV